MCYFHYIYIIRKALYSRLRGGATADGTS